MPTVVQKIETPKIGYANHVKPATERPLRNGIAVLTEQENTLPKYVEIPVDREKTLQSIAFLTQYLEDLKAGKPVENLRPSNDPYYLVPENIATWIDREKSLLKEKPMGIVFTSMKDLIGEWENI